MTKFLVGITSAQALHTWQYADKTRLSRMGSSAILSEAARKKRHSERSTIGEYQTSKIAMIATHMRRDVAEFTLGERQKLTTRRDQAQLKNDSKNLPPPIVKKPEKPDAPLYHRPLF